MNKILQSFLDKTQEIHILLSSALILILIVMVAPVGTRYFKTGGQILIIGFLLYIVYLNFTVTLNFNNKLKNKKPDDLLIDMKNNVYISYTLSAFIVILIVYLSYSLFY
jgi:hypothetical protein